MPEPDPPIPLDYKTPERVDRVSVWKIVWRLTVGLLGLFWLMLSAWFSIGVIYTIFDSPTLQIKRLGFSIVLFVIAMIGWILTISCLRYAIIGDRKIPKPSD